MNIPVHGSFNAGMPQKFLKCLGRHPAFDGAGGIGVPQGVHTEPLDPVLITNLIEVGIITAVLARLAGSEVDEYQISQKELHLLTGSAVNVG